MAKKKDTEAKEEKIETPATAPTDPAPAPDTEPPASTSPATPSAVDVIAALEEQRAVPARAVLEPPAPRYFRLMRPARFVAERCVHELGAGLVVCDRTHDIATLIAQGAELEPAAAADMGQPFDAYKEPVRPWRGVTAVALSGHPEGQPVLLDPEGNRELLPRDEATEPEKLEAVIRGD